MKEHVVRYDDRD